MSHISMPAFALFSRGQPPARQTKVVDDGQRPLKTGHTCLSVPVCTIDATTSKPASVGRVVVDDPAHTTGKCTVCCGSVRCKTCQHMHAGSTFVSYVLRKQYYIVSSNSSMDCTTSNVVYLISCRRCGVQYIGETSQLIRKRFANHKNRLKNMTNLYLYNHFSSDGHSVDDICIMPIEKVASNRLDREDFWCRELCTYYLYGLNDNIKGVGNISKMKDRLVVNTLFHRNKRKYRKRNHRHRRKYHLGDITSKLEYFLQNYKDSNFCFNVRTFILGLPKRCICMVWNALENWVSSHALPSRVRVLLKDLLAFRQDRVSLRMPSTCTVGVKHENSRGFIKILYDNKGIEMIDIPRILNSKHVKNAVPPFLKNKETPMVTYSYTKTISNKIFNHRSVVRDMNLDIDTTDMHCTCSNSSYCYEPAGHVITGDLTIIRDAKLRSLIQKGPNYREQNYINWEINKKLCRNAIKEYKKKWSSKEGVDIRAFSEWEHKVMDGINNKIVSLRSKHINKRKKHVLGNKHLESSMTSMY